MTSQALALRVPLINCIFDEILNATELHLLTPFVYSNFYQKDDSLRMHKQRATTSQ